MTASPFTTPCLYAYLNTFFQYAARTPVYGAVYAAAAEHEYWRHLQWRSACSGDITLYEFYHKCMQLDKPLQNRMTSHLQNGRSFFKQIIIFIIIGEKKGEKAG